jgi:3-deoxy-manno-octulosonate cytidylyltransferase (CMP-KDO synthetase)
MKAVIVIPARYGSTRFPGKPLARIAGVSLIERVHARVSRSTRATAVYVATDDDRIAAHVRGFGGRVLSPAGDFHTGTDRIAAAVRELEAADPEARFDIVVNVQGDEPLIDVGDVDRLIDRAHEAGAEMATMACPLTSEEEFLSRDVVKVVMDRAGLALYFSRAPIGSRETAHRHIGIYAYRRDALDTFVGLPPSSLELAESLEQLRALQRGFRIAVLPTSRPHLGVDRPEDVARVEDELANGH